MSGCATLIRPLNTVGLPKTMYSVHPKPCPDVQADNKRNLNRNNRVIVPDSAWWHAYKCPPPSDSHWHGQPVAPTGTKLPDCPAQASEYVPKPVRARFNLLLHEKVLMFLKNFPSFFKNIKVFLCTYALVYTYGGTSLRVRMRKPTHIYASGYTYIRINLHLYRYYVRCRIGQIGTVRLWLRKI